MLIINKCIEDTESSGARSLEQDGENRVLDEDDGEVKDTAFSLLHYICAKTFQVIFVSPSASSPVCVEYSCVLHRIYQVPVLYFTFKNKIGRKQYTIDDVYSLLIPKDQHTHLCDVGVLGAVTMGVCIAKSLYEPDMQLIQMFRNISSQDDRRFSCIRVILQKRFVT